MPKTFSNSKKEQWLEQYSQGRTEKQIAHSSKCDIRTVKRAIEETRGRRAAQEALTQLYQEAIRDHMKKLNMALDRIINELSLPDPKDTEIAWLDINTSQNPLHPQGEVEKLRMFGHEDDILSEGTLLAEHLRNGKAWRVYADWKRNQEKYRIACIQLQLKIVEIMSGTTGLTVQVKENGIAPFFDIEVAGNFFYRSVILHVFEKDGASKLEKELVIDGEHGVVKHRGIPLAEGFEDTQKTSDGYDKIIESLKLSKESHEAKQVLNMFQQLEKTLPKVKNELLVVRLMGVLPGQCRICHQFGL